MNVVQNLSGSMMGKKEHISSYIKSEILILNIKQFLSPTFYLTQTLPESSWNEYDERKNLLNLEFIKFSYELVRHGN